MEIDNQMSQIPPGKIVVGIDVHSDKVWIIDAVCINCKKRFKSMRAVSMHLKVMAARHAVIFINNRNYDKKIRPVSMKPTSFMSG
jgi:hypothetical protein